MCGQFAGFFFSGDRDGTMRVWMAGDQDRQLRWGEDGANFTDQGEDEIVSYSPCQSLMRLTMLL